MQRKNILGTATKHYFGNYNEILFWKLQRNSILGTATKFYNIKVLSKNSIP